MTRLGVLLSCCLFGASAFGYPASRPEEPSRYGPEVRIKIGMAENEVQQILGDARWSTEWGSCFVRGSPGATLKEVAESFGWPADALIAINYSEFGLQVDYAKGKVVAVRRPLNR